MIPVWLNNLIISYPIQVYFGMHIVLILLVIELRKFVIFLFKKIFKKKSKTINSQQESVFAEVQQSKTSTSFSPPADKIIHDTSDPLFFVNKRVHGRMGK